MKKIVLITSEFPPLPGGIGTHAYHLAMGFTQKGYDVSVLTDRRSTDDAIEDMFDTSLPFTVHRVSRKSFGRTYFTRIRKAFQLVKKDPTSTVIASGKFSLWLGALLRIRYSKLKTLAVIHGTELKAGGWLSRLITKKSLSSFSKIIAVSQFTKSKVLEVHPQASVTVITNGVVLPESPPKVSQKKEGVRLISVGNVTRRKGQHNVIAALPLLREAYPGIHYDVVGLPTETERLQHLATSLDVASLVTFHGALPEQKMQELLLQSHIFMLLSEHLPNGDFEGFGIVVLEANALGIPAIGTRDSGIADAIVHGQTGLLVNPHQPEEIKAAIAIILANYELYSSRALEWAKANQWPDVIEQYLQELTP